MCSLTSVVLAPLPQNRCFYSDDICGVT